MNNTPFVVISQHTNTPETMTMHRYVGKTHSGQLQFSIDEVDSSASINKLAEEYRVGGDAIFETEPEYPEAV